MRFHNPGNTGQWPGHLHKNPVALAILNPNYFILRFEQL